MQKQINPNRGKIRQVEKFEDLAYVIQEFQTIIRSEKNISVSVLSECNL